MTCPRTVSQVARFWYGLRPLSATSHRAVYGPGGSHWVLYLGWQDDTSPIVRHKQ